MIGKMLADYRYANRMSMRDLAKELQVSVATVCRIESGKPMEQKTIIMLINIMFGDAEINKRQKPKAK